MTSKERAVLKTQAMRLDSIYQIGKSSLTPQMVDAIRDALKARELIKISVLKNCLDDPREIATVLSERTGSEVVQVIGKKIILYKKNHALEEKRKRAAKRKMGVMKNSARKGSSKTGNSRTGSSKMGSSRTGTPKNAAAQSASGKMGRRRGIKSAGSQSGHSTSGKQMKWSDR